MRGFPKAAPAALAAVLWLAAFPPGAAGTEEYARLTGSPCGRCHVDPAGGGALTAAGTAFLSGTSKADGTVPPGERHGPLRFAAGFLHLFFGVLWFGTILYVHLLLKPAYAARGLPRGELFVGWLSIAMIAASGTVLTLLRIRSAGDLVHTRFGILLSVKIALFLVMAGTAVIVTFVVGPRLKSRPGQADPRKKDLTREELARCTGKDGAPAWFAYRGTIYDAGGSGLWKGGSHVGKHLSGFDLTDALKGAPHGEDRVLALPVVGRLVDSGPAARRPAHLAAFYFMTYLNLVLVLGVLLVVALWRWG